MTAGQHERYTEASERLRKQLRDSKVYEEANAWALKVCSEAEQFNWASRPCRTETWDVGKSATKLADHLKSTQLREDMKAAEEQSGVKLGLDAVSLAKYLRALAEQCQKEDWLVCGPLMMKFTDKNQIKMPPKATALAVALTYGFRCIPNCVKNNEGFLLRLGGHMDEVRRTDGQPCLPAAVLFANAALKKEVTDEEATVNAAKQWMKNNRGRFRYWGFGITKR